jgi:dTDP-4-dehydrorhamnose reductase
MTTDESRAAPAMPILVLGATGMLGRAWCRLLESRGHDFATASRPAFDLTKPRSVTATVTRRFRTVVNCAGWTDVDGAEAHEDEAMSVNAQGVARLAERCGDLGITLVHYSTDYVFDGSARTTPWPVEAPLGPLNAYGRSKAAGEVAVIDSGCDHLLIRTSWLYAPWGRNFVRSIADRARAGLALRVVDDQWGRPSDAREVAETSHRLLEGGRRGTFHVGGRGACSWYDLAVEIVSEVGTGGPVERCSSTEHPRPASRPAYGVLDIEATEAAVGPARDWRESVRSALRDAVVSDD